MLSVTRSQVRCGNAAPAARTQRLSPMVARSQGEEKATVAEVERAQPLTPAEPVAAAQSVSQQLAQLEAERRKPKRQAGSTDAVATFLTRRFGIAGGLAWLGVLAVGSIGEQVKTRMEVAEAEQGTKDIVAGAEVVLPSGVRYTDLRVGGGQVPPKGYLVVVDYVGRANGVVFEDTKARGKPIVFFFGAKTYTGGMCAGAIEVLASMKAGGKRRVIVPPQMGFGSQGATLRPTEHVPDKQGIIPANAELEYELELVRVSIPP